MKTSTAGFKSVFRGSLPPEYFILPGNPPSLKNGKVLFVRKTKSGKHVPGMTSNSTVKDWADKALPYILSQAKKFRDQAKKIEGPVVLIAQYFVGRADRFDFGNKAETIADAISGSLYRKEKTAFIPASNYWVEDDSFKDLIIIPHPTVFKSADPFVLLKLTSNYDSFIAGECTSPIHTNPTP